MKNNTSSPVRVVLSTISMIVFMFYMLLNKMVMSDSIYDRIYHYTYGWRVGILNDIFLFFPFLMLFIFALMERKNEGVNKRNYISWIFALQLVQFIFTLFGSTSRFSLFCSKEFDYLSTVVYVIVAVRVLMLFLVPMAKPIFLKGYCLGMIGLFILLLNGVIYSAYHWGDPLVEVCIPLIPDLLFYVAFYFFSDLMTEENETAFGRLFLEGFLGMVESFFTDDDDWDDWDEFDDFDFEGKKVVEDDKKIDIDAGEEYQKIVSYALITENESFPAVNHFFEKLSRNVFTEEGKYYPTEKYKENLTLLKSLVAEIEKKEEGYISNDFVHYVDEILREEKEEVFKLKVVIAAKKFYKS